MVPFIFEAAVEGKDGLQLLDELEMDSMLKWAEEEEAHNDAQQARRYEAYLERQGKAST
jgi:hypothetical protein